MLHTSVSVFVLLSFAIGVKLRECVNSTGERCKLKCCGSVSRVKCFERCLGISCSHDYDCDGDCCVSSICDSCNVRKLRTEITRKPFTKASKIKTRLSMRARTISTASKVISRSGMTEKSTSQRDSGKVEPKVGFEKIADGHNKSCFILDSQCASNCCIGRKCVDFLHCARPFNVRGKISKKLPGEGRIWSSITGLELGLEIFLMFSGAQVIHWALFVVCIAYCARKVSDTYGVMPVKDV